MLKYRNTIYIHIFLKTSTKGVITKNAKPYYDGVWNNTTYSYSSSTTDTTIRTNVKNAQYKLGWRWINELLTQLAFFTKYGFYPTPKI